MTITVVGIIDEHVLNNLIKEGICTSLEDLEFDDTQDFDYAQVAIIDKEKKCIYYWNDNIHSNPDAIIEAIEHVQSFGINVVIEKIVMMVDELNSYSGVKYRE